LRGATLFFSAAGGQSAQLIIKARLPITFKRLITAVRDESDEP
jgi:hypothetical protein